MIRGIFRLGLFAATVAAGFWWAEKRRERIAKSA